MSVKETEKARHILHNLSFFQRGKFRPRLTELVQQNDPAEVEKVTQDAIAALPNLETAVKTLTRLKAVGPATASGLKTQTSQL